MDGQERKSYVIVVATDYSDAGSLALDQAIELANARPDSELHVLHVGIASGSAIDIELASQLLRVTEVDAIRLLQTRIEMALKNLDTRSPGGNLKRVVTHHRIGDAAEEIAQLASDLDADVVVVGTHGRRGIRRFMLGSVAETVVRLAPCPVLVVRPKQIQSVPRIEPACPDCVLERRRSAGKEWWCSEHRAHHGSRHVVHYVDRNTAAAVDSISKPL